MIKRKDSRYPGVIIIETPWLKRGADMVLPPFLIVAGDYRLYYGEAIMQHGYGHFLQRKKHGFWYYYLAVVPASFWAAVNRNDYAWPELEANKLAHHFLVRNP
ncbi:MAG: hypothetical protein HC830_10515 [Bacteroidetes bacterium]|nr:hypothetical protein [Bacteroidota bacterium]